MTTLPPLVLMYHRVADESIDPWGLCVSAAHFAEHLDVLSRHARTVPVAELLLDRADGGHTPRVVAITFDDGYADNLLAAAPPLERFGLPATVFVTTGYTERGREFWWDALERLFLESGVLPAALDLRVAGAERRLDLGGAAHYPPEEARRHAAWRAYSSDPPTERHAAFLSTWEHLVTLRDAEQWQALASLRTAAGSVPETRASRRQLSALEIDTLVRGGLVDVGAHTVTHPALPQLDPDAQRSEIHGSREMLEGIVGRTVGGFSYPHGRFSEATVRIVRDVGFTYACSATPGPALERSAVADPFTLGRVMVSDCDGDAFQRLLEGGHSGS